MKNNHQSNPALAKTFAALAILAGLFAASDSQAASLLVTGYESAGNVSLSKSSVTGPVTVSRGGSAVYFANNREYRDTAGFKASANFGSNKVSGYASSQAFGVVGGGSSSWTDELMLTSQNSTGFLKVLIDVSVDLEAILRGGAGSNHSYELSHFTPGAFGTPYRESTRLDGFGYSITTSGAANIQEIYSGPSSRRLVTVMLPYLSGQRLTVSSYLSCAAQSGRGSGAGEVGQIASCNAGRSAYWAGIAGVTDASGNSVAGWTLNSASGTDYKQSFVPIAAVPEPASWLMMLAGFAMVGGLLRSSANRRRLCLASEIA